MIDRFAAEIKSRIAARRVALAEQIAKGSAQEFHAYREKVGEIRALDTMLAEIDGIASEFLKG